MELYINGRRMTERVEIASCVHRDAALDRADGMEIEFYRAADWNQWRIETDTVIGVTHGGYSTGVLYVNRVRSEGDRYLIHATSLPARARRSACRSYFDLSLRALVRQCAAECALEGRVYGLDENTVYHYLSRENEGCAAFLARILRREGAALKVVEGRMCAIGIGYAQKRDIEERITLRGENESAEYERADGTPASRLDVVWPGGSVSAWDRDAAGNPERTVSLRARDAAEAGRWARGLLLMQNREADALYLETAFNAGLTALARIRIDGSTEANGDYLVDEVRHDFIKNTSSATLKRCRYGITGG